MPRLPLSLEEQERRRCLSPARPSAGPAMRVGRVAVAWGRRTRGQRGSALGARPGFQGARGCSPPCQSILQTGLCVPLGAAPATLMPADSYGLAGSCALIYLQVQLSSPTGGQNAITRKPGGIGAGRTAQAPCRSSPARGELAGTPGRSRGTPGSASARARNPGWQLVLLGGLLV